MAGKKAIEILKAAADEVVAAYLAADVWRLGDALAAYEKAKEATS